MIDPDKPINWKELQSAVGRIFTEVGLTVEIGKKAITPRGTVELDVFAVDEKSVDQISYVVECKNWESGIPQNVVHGFTTVMHEVGANIGYIVSRNGLQKGAEKYTESTNIRGLTFLEFQAHYFPVWFRRWFLPRLAEVADPLMQYVEPIASFRDREMSFLSPELQARCTALINEYADIGMALGVFGAAQLSPFFLKNFKIEPPKSVEEFKVQFNQAFGGKISITSDHFRGILAELELQIAVITNRFDLIFGRRIFEDSIKAEDFRLRGT